MLNASAATEMAAQLAAVGGKVHVEHTERIARAPDRHAEVCTREIRQVLRGLLQFRWR